MNKDVRDRLEGWRQQSPDTPGFHEVFIPNKSDCKAIYMYRLNLEKGSDYVLNSGSLEMNGAMIKGSVTLKSARLDDTIKKLDSFYICPNCSLTITALEDTIIYIAGADGQDTGLERATKFDITLPIGDIHQIHGEGAGRREVMFTCEPAFGAKRLLCGLTWSAPGAWTSWPPHQHEKDLEEAYCYFDMDDPKMGLHISYLKSGEREDIVAHPVQSGTMVLAPVGYHPTVAMPGTTNAYFWALAAFSDESRSYDLAILDPQLTKEV